MGSVIDWVECPNCHTEEGCASDFYYKTGEEYINCGECGYHKSVAIRSESRGKNLNELTDDDWVVNELANPWGSYRIKQAGMVSMSCGSFKDEQQYREVREEVLAEIRTIDEFTLSRFVDGEIVKTRIVESSRVLDEMV